MCAEKFRVSFYEEVPESSMHLQRLEDLAEERLKMLQIIEKGAKKRLGDAPSEAALKAIKRKLRRYHLNDYLALLEEASDSSPPDLNAVSQARENDLVAHLILRTAIAINSEPVRSWFTIQEARWFLMRFLTIETKRLPEFLRLNHIDVHRLSDSEKLEYYLKVRNCESGYSLEQDIYRVHFREAPLLVGRRRCHLEKGYAYFAYKGLVQYILVKFMKTLGCHLQNLRRLRLDDERLDNLLESINAKATLLELATTGNVKVEGQANHEVEQITSLLDRYSAENYPLCMRMLHEKFTEAHHLRYFACLQYGLFLKHIGVPYDQALAFWERGFTRKLSKEQYQRDYEYRFKHQYGKVGYRNRYDAHSCDRIIRADIGALDQHGCPFVVWSQERLRNQLVKDKFSADRIESVLRLVQERNYKGACVGYFQGMHKSYLGAFTRPDEYFHCSRHLKGQKSPSQAAFDNLPDIEDMFKDA